ncbi:hypothetical protein V499_06882 [Pseudogymnoascus sp. VKM F-103]|nr:hypothetical protein V499_06882 [Pseudogymnoascus sp. VKM F-103]
MVGTLAVAAATMPPQRSALTSSFPLADATNEVVCPLRNHDGSGCRKRCLGEKRYRSMQEHIRRAHPEHYISKLPATEESFQLMINTPPSERPQPAQQQQQQQQAQQQSLSSTAHAHERNHYASSSGPGTPRNIEEYTSVPPIANAAAALAQLHTHKVEPEWDSDMEWHSDTELHHPRSMLSSIELPPLRRLDHPTSSPYTPLPRQNDRLSALLSHSPPNRSSTLPPIRPPQGHARPRKQSLSRHAREPPHKRHKSRDGMGLGHMRRGSYERKAMSAEPSGFGYGKRWEDLLDAATSATSDVGEDRTPLPASPLSAPRSSLPPAQMQAYTASPLQQALTPPAYNFSPPALPSVETIPTPERPDHRILDRGPHDHRGSDRGPNSDPSNGPDRGPTNRLPGLQNIPPHPSGGANVQIYCAACQGFTGLGRGVRRMHAWDGRIDEIDGFMIFDFGVCVCVCDEHLR